MTNHSAANCQWAMPTLFLSAPFWFDAWDSPWACLKDQPPRVLDTTELCATCDRWEPKAPERPARPRK